jgi:hypothetical protein
MPTTRATSGAGILVGLGGVVTVPLYFMYAGPPPAWDVLTRNLITIVVCMAMIVFFVGLRRTLPDDLVTAGGLILTTVILVGTSLEAGAVIGNAGPSVDPTTTGPLAHGTILIHGSIGRALTVVLLVAAGRTIIRSRALPAWTGWLAYLIAAVNLAFVPSLYFGDRAATFYSALGWGNSAMTASLIAWWVFAVAVALLRTSPPQEPEHRQPSRPSMVA